MVAAALAVALLVRRAPSGVAFLAAAALFAAVRWAVYPLRHYPTEFAGPGWEYPALYSGVIAVLVALLAWRLRSARETRTAARATPPSG